MPNDLLLFKADAELTRHQVADLAGQLTHGWYEARGLRDTEPSPRDLSAAAKLIERNGPARSAQIAGHLCRMITRSWPDCRSFSGAVQKYGGDAVKAAEAEDRRREAEEIARRVVDEDRHKKAAEEAELRARRERWLSLPREQQQTIMDRIRERIGTASAPGAFLDRLCLEELCRGQLVDGQAQPVNAVAGQAVAEDPPAGDAAPAIVPFSCPSCGVTAWSEEAAELLCYKCHQTMYPPQKGRSDVRQ